MQASEASTPPAATIARAMAPFLTALTATYLPFFLLCETGAAEPVLAALAAPAATAVAATPTTGPVAAAPAAASTLAPAAVPPAAPPTTGTLGCAMTKPAMTRPATDNANSNPAALL